MNRANRPRLSRISGSSYASRAMSRAGDGSTLSLDFTTGVLDPRLTFTRSTTGTYINSSGYVTSAAINVPRFDYDPTTLAPRGLLIEGSVTNLVLQSDTLPTPTNWVANAITRTNVSTVTPDGNTTATTCGLSHTGAGSFRSNPITVTASTAYTFSFWAKNNGGSVALYRAYNVSGSADIVAETSYFSQINGSTWTRVRFTFTTPVGCTSVYVYPLSQSSGTSNVLIWGAQLEAGSGASSYIPTGASQGTRNQDQMQMTDLASLGFNTSAGTITINGTYVKDANSAAYPRSIRFMGASIQSMAMITSGKTLFGNTPNTSGGSYFESSRILASAGAFKFGWTLTTAVNPALASATVSLNGSSTSITPLGQGAIVNPTSLQFLYGAGATTDYPSMNISLLKYWPYATTAADLNVRTSL